MDEDIQQQMEQLKLQQSLRNRAARQACAMRVLTWVIGLVGDEPASLSVATIQRLLMEAPCDLQIASEDKNRWSKPRVARDNTIFLYFMIDDGNGGGSSAGGRGSSFVEALRGAISELRKAVSGEEHSYSENSTRFFTTAARRGG